MNARLCLVLMLAAGLLRADLAAVKAEPNLEKRSERALENADAVMKTMREHYQTGEWKQVLAALDEIRGSVELAWESLQQTGKHARRSPKYFKRAEMKTRELGRRLDDFSKQVSVDDREAVEKVAQRVQEVHEELLLAIMSKK